MLQRGPGHWTVPRAEVGVFEKKDLLMVPGPTPWTQEGDGGPQSRSIVLHRVRERRDGEGEILMVHRGGPDHEVAWRGQSPSRQESQGGRVWRQEPSDGGGKGAEGSVQWHFHTAVGGGCIELGVPCELASPGLEREEGYIEFGVPCELASPGVAELPFSFSVLATFPAWEQ